jgi:hypothetical protein
LRFSVDRRAVTETYLSYAGTTDPYSGKRWGGVVKTGGKASIESSIGLWNTFAQAGGAMFTGNNVASNADYELSAGATYPIWSYNKEELRTGVETHYTSYNKNLRYFTYGQGGYFSPQRFITVLAPITYRNQVGYAFSYQLDGAVGYQEFSEKSSPYYPTSQSLQKQLEAVTGNPLLNTSYTPHRGSGITGTVAARGEYRVTPNFTIGAGASFGNAGVYQSYGGNVYGRYVFNDFYDR